ncbi:MAG TPA: sulfatase-like hydrolase/transferase [Spirochaetia bacterium]|nr:sulfatase-like hydrolase/transferase [Spirochaetia bacterium]
MAEGKPNVIVFLTDQQRWDTTGVGGNPLDVTPNFDRVAAGGTHFSHTFTCQPVCAPARSSLQTGMYATSTGVFSNGRALADDAVTLAQCFRASGYRTGYIGKWHLGGVELGLKDWKQEPVPVARRGGYEYWLAADAVEFTSDAYHTVLFDNNNKSVELPGYRVDALTDAAIRYVADNREAPFFLFLSFLEPHHQNHTDNYPAPDGYEERFRGRWLPPDLAALGGTAHHHFAGYLGMIKRLDEAFGRLLDVLKSLSLDRRTIVAFTSDHGNHFRTRNREYKRSCHESSVRVPLTACGPGFDRGGRIDSLVSLVDLPPTLLDAAGIEIPRTMQGRSAMPLVRGTSADWQDDVFIQISESQVGRALRTRRWKYSVSAEGLDGFAVPDAQTYTEECLFDLDSDPYELTNLAGLDSHEHVSQQMKSRLLRRILITEGKQPEIVDAPKRKDEDQRVVFPGDLPG